MSLEISDRLEEARGALENEFTRGFDFHAAVS
jgi:hypothetical protein